MHDFIFSMLMYHVVTTRVPLVFFKLVSHLFTSFCLTRVQLSYLALPLFTTVSPMCTTSVPLTRHNSQPVYHSCTTSLPLCVNGLYLIHL